MYITPCIVHSNSGRGVEDFVPYVGSLCEISRLVDGSNSMRKREGGVRFFRLAFGVELLIRLDGSSSRGAYIGVGFLC